MAKFSPGDQAYFMASSPQKDIAGIHGEIVTLLQYKGEVDPKWPRRDYWVVSATSGDVYASESCLVPIDGYDGNKAGSWEMCPWKPMEVTNA